MWNYHMAWPTVFYVPMPKNKGSGASGSFHVYILLKPRWPHTSNVLLVSKIDKGHRFDLKFISFSGVEKTHNLKRLS